MISINSKEELSLYNLEGKWNDYVAVQKEIIAVLKQRKFFEQCDILNDKTNMVIRLTARGIKETLGNGTRFQYLPKVVKMQKIVTLRYLPLMIKNADLIEDEVENYHEDEVNRFAYFKNIARIDGEVYSVRIVVRKKIGSNHFYIHHIDTEKSSELLSPSLETVDYEIQNSNILISCFIEFVNKQYIDSWKRRMLVYGYRCCRNTNAVL
jgi:hypothetical protein